jgi:hypothetical protein
MSKPMHFTAQKLSMPGVISVFSVQSALPGARPRPTRFKSMISNAGFRFDRAGPQVEQGRAALATTPYRSLTAW